MASAYRYGRTKERSLARFFRSRGARVKLSKGSRGAADMKVRSPRRKWAVQVKSSPTKPASLTRKAATRLKISASRSKSAPVLAQIKRNKVRFSSVRTGRRLHFK